MKKASNWITALVSFCLLFSGSAVRADDLENLLSNRQRVLNQFNDSGVPVRPLPAGSSRESTGVQSSSSGDTSSLISSAMGLLGVAYRYGGTSARTGFDCSGFMQYIFRNSLGMSLPRTSAEQARMGTHVNRSELQAGDMVFFRTLGGRISHVGLYIGNDRFIHAPRTGKSIEITSLSHKYWGSKYAFARRVKKNDPSRFLN